MLIVILILLLVGSIDAQEWSAPLSISNIPGPDTYPNYCVDTIGVLHCVWSHIYNLVDDKRVFYSKSTDNGDTWTQPILVSEDSISVAVFPIIKSDSQNNLYVAYSFGSGNEDSQVHFRKFDGIAWSEIFNVGDCINQVSALDMVVDNSNRVYVFIYYGGTYGLSLYRYLEETTWSDIYVLYDGETYNNTIYNVKCDTNNNLHCLSVYKPNGQTIYSNRAAYSYFDSNLNEWSSPLILGNAYTPSGLNIGDINLDNNQNPSITWRQDENYGTGYYTFFEDSVWQGPLVIADSLYDVRHVIDRFNNRHWVGVKRSYNAPYTWTYNLEYTCDPSNTPTTITNFSYGTFYPRLLYRNNKLFLLFSGSSISGQPEVYIIKKELPESLIDESDVGNNLGISALNLYPNPSSSKLTITYQGGVVVSPLNYGIYNIKGQKLYSGSISSVNAEVSFDIPTEVMSGMSSGLFLICLEQQGKRIASGRFLITK